LDAKRDETTARVGKWTEDEDSTLSLSPKAKVDNFAPYGALLVGEREAEADKVAESKCWSEQASKSRRRWPTNLDIFILEIDE
jgi:hypothetical protein